MLGISTTQAIPLLNMRRGRLFEEEAACDDSEPDESLDDGSEGSLADFIVNDNDNAATSAKAKRKRGRPPKNAALTNAKRKKQRIDSENESANDGDDDDFTPTTSNKAAVPAVEKRKRGRPRKNIDAVNQKPSSNNSKASQLATVAPKGPGHPSFPINDFSLTITKTNADVGRDAFESVAVFIKEHCVKGGVATEVGRRKFQFHLQGIMRMHWPVTLSYLAILQKCIRDLLPLKGVGYKVNCKPFHRGQNFSAMTGYITKDEGNNF